jgi:hypothetical protein
MLSAYPDRRTGEFVNRWLSPMSFTAAARLKERLATEVMSAAGEI